MIQSLALILLVGLVIGALFQKIKLPRIIGMLFTGILLGPSLLNLIDAKALSISSELRQIALVIILLKAGLSLDIEDLKKVGRPAIRLSFVPASFEILGYFLLAPLLLGVSQLEALLMGSVLAAVSPAVVVPRMVQLKEEGYGQEKRIPELILSGASCDDVFVIVLFSTFLNLVQGIDVSALTFLTVPVSIVLGILLGALTGALLSHLFETAFARKHLIRNSIKVIITLAMAFLLLSVELWLKGIVPVSGYLAIMSMAVILRKKSIPFVAERLSEKFGKLWLGAEIMLFVLVGSAVDIGFTLKAGPLALVVIVLALFFRSAGVLVSLLHTNLNPREKLFSAISYLPKATVQAAIGSVPLAMGLSVGPLILSISVLAILLTAPLGAMGMDLTYKKLLDKKE